MELVRITNDDDVPFIGMFNGQRYIIKPRSETVVPFEAMCLWMGNPNSRDLDAKRRDRTSEYRRLRVKYGVYEHNDREDQLPRLSAFNMEGEKIVTVLDDPEGKNITTTAATVQDDESLREEVVRLRGLVERLVGEREPRPDFIGDESMAGEELDDEVTEDTPVRVPVG